MQPYQLTIPAAAAALEEFKRQIEIEALDRIATRASLEPRRWRSEKRAYAFSDDMSADIMHDARAARAALRHRRTDDEQGRNLE